MIRCYRGIAEGHTYYQEALRGIARPRGGHATPAQHNEGFTESEFTSWTTSYQAARRKALESDMNGHGIILQKDFDEAQLTASPDVYGESEFLIYGLVIGAVVREVPE